jgi:hypothetical protein
MQGAIIGGIIGGIAVSSLFVRDPMHTYDYEHYDDGFDPKLINTHFENLQSTNWNSMM